MVVVVIASVEVCEVGSLYRAKLKSGEPQIRLPSFNACKFLDLTTVHRTSIRSVFFLILPI